MRDDTLYTIGFPVWRYLTQPVFEAGVEIHLDPLAFWRHYRVEFLEHCWQLTSESSNLN